MHKIKRQGRDKAKDKGKRLRQNKTNKKKTTQDKKRPL